MGREDAKFIKFELVDEGMPPPIFANNISVTNTDQYTTITFRAGLLGKYTPSDDELPECVQARPVAQIVMPNDVWRGLLDGLRPGDESTGEED